MCFGGLIISIFLNYRGGMTINQSPERNNDLKAQELKRHRKPFQNVDGSKLKKHFLSIYDA